MLDGALALGLPTKLGQWLRVKPLSEGSRHQWRSLLPDGTPWFEATLSAGGTLLSTTDQQAGKRLEALLSSVEAQRPGFWSHQPLLQFETQLEFEREWGLGSSSTLVAGLARWAGIDPFELLRGTFGGSGYDIACALANKPVLFQRHQQKPAFVEIPYVPAFASHICFAYLGQKQDSRAGIKAYRKRGGATPAEIREISALSLAFLQARTAEEAILTLEAHESLMSHILGQHTVQRDRFPNFPGVVKSLGAWGGDFVMAISDRPAEAIRQYFRIKGYAVTFAFDELAAYSG